MTRLLTALLFVISLPALANPDDPCIADARLMREVSTARDTNVSMQDLIARVQGRFDDSQDYERYLRKMAFAFGNPELSADAMADAIYRACLGH